MSTTLKTNGTEKKADTKPELSTISIPVPAPVSLKPIDERLKRFQELELLKERREELTEALEKLQGFQISPTGGANLKISDGKGNQFGVAHPIVIGEIVHLAKAKLQEELNNVDALFIL